MFTRRLGPTPAPERCQALKACPDILEMESGDFAIIGKNITATAVGQLPEYAGCGPDECIVRIPRSLLVLAKHDIPDGM